MKYLTHTLFILWAACLTADAQSPEAVNAEKVVIPVKTENVSVTPKAAPIKTTVKTPQASPQDNPPKTAPQDNSTPKSENSKTTPKDNSQWANKERLTPKEIPGGGSVFWKTCLSLAAVIAIILLIFAGLKKVNHRLINNGTNSPLRVNYKLPLDNKNYMALVRSYEEEYLIAVGPQGSTLIARYSLIDKEPQENEDFETLLNKDGKVPVIVNESDHIASIDLKSLKDYKK